MNNKIGSKHPNSVFVKKNSPMKNQNNKIHPNLVDMFVRELVRLSISEQEVAVD